MEVVKGFDLAEYKDFMGEKLKASKDQIVSALKEPLKIAVGGSLDYVSASCLVSPSNLVKGLSGLAAGLKEPALNAIDKM